MMEFNWADSYLCHSLLWMRWLLVSTVTKQESIVTGSHSVHLQAHINITPSDGEFTNRRGEFTFSQGDIESCTSVFAIGDNSVEDTEEFDIVLDTTDRALTLTNRIATISIESNDGKLSMHNLYNYYA